MNTKLILSSSAILMAAMGLALSFMPQELLALIQVSPAGVAPLFLQVAGAMYLAFAMMNWMIREAVIGGIYNRAIAMANTIHFTIGALSILRGFRSNPFSVPLVGACAVYLLFAVLFGILLFMPPNKKKEN